LGAGEGIVQKHVTGLNPNTQYDVTCTIENVFGVTYGDIETFGVEVQQASPSVTTLPDPNSSPIAFNSSEPDTLSIQNFVKAFQTDPNHPHNDQGMVTYTERAGNLATLDYNDILYSVEPETLQASKIISLLPRTIAQGEVGGFYELSRDARPDIIDANDQDNLILLELSLVSTFNPDLNTTSQNSLKFWIANDTNSIELTNAFGGKPLTLQRIPSNPNEPGLVYPLWDIRNIIEKNGRQLPLDNLFNQKPNTPYAFYELSTGKELLDINEDETIDLNDYHLVLDKFGKTGVFRSDIASAKGPGLPDGKVDMIDEVIFIKEYNKRYPDNPIANPYVEFSEDFESGAIAQPFFSSGDEPWTIDSNPYTGYCAKSGSIENNQISVLEASIETASGKISFHYKVSCESGYDYLLFTVDDMEAWRWSGQKDWEKVEFQTTPGAHDLKWIYVKNYSTSEGQDCVWIDDIEFPASMF
jgi:hypothetical protein